MKRAPGIAKGPTTIQNNMYSVGVYCSASEGVPQDYKDLAYTLGRSIGQEGWRLVYGGSHLSLMGAVADGCLSVGGQILGVTTEYFKEIDRPHPGITELQIVASMHQRKMKMFEAADAFVILPGGFGTLDEASELLAWRQIKIDTKPILLVNYKGFWSPFLNLLDHIIQEKFALPEHRALLEVIDNTEDIIPKLEAFKERR